MKITKTRIRQIIKEAMHSYDYDQAMADEERIADDQESLYMSALDSILAIIQSRGAISDQALTGELRKDRLVSSYSAEAINDMLEELESTGEIEWDEMSGQWVVI